MKMQNLMENWKKYLNEVEDSTNTDKIQAIKDILLKNPHTSDLAEKLTNDNIVDTGKLIYLNFPDSLKTAPHMRKHFDQGSAGSIWSISEEEAEKLILETLKKPPTFTGQEGPVFKYKWMNQQAQSDIGFDSLIKIKPEDSNLNKEIDLEKFGMVDRIKDWVKISHVVKQNDYNLVTQDGKEYTEEDLKNNAPGFLEQEILVKKGDKKTNPTKFYNLITAKIGDVEGKPLLSLMTVFPGMNPVDSSGKDVLNKKDLAAAGYALIKPAGDIKESRRISKKYLQKIIKEELQKVL